MKRLLLMIGMMILLVQTISAFASSVPSNIYLDVNRTYPLILIPLDENVWNITLNVFDNGNLSKFNFTWTGSQYELNLLFSEVGNYPFVINSTEVAGDITGTFLVRDSFNVTIRLYKNKQSFPFYSNKYVNEMSYVTAELTGERTFFSNSYDANLEPFVASLPKPESMKKPVWYAVYNNGVANLKLYEEDEYALRLIDGEIIFNGEYSVPNITDSYGVNAYLGKFDLDNETGTISLLVEQKDLYPYRWLLNWVFVIGIGAIILVSVFLFFMLPETPALPLIFGIGFSFLFIVFRIVFFIWKGW